MHLRARPSGLVSVLLLGISATACAPATVQMPSLSSGPSAPAVQSSISDRLYFGRSIPGGGTVSQADWAAFLREVVTPRFPAGLTVWRAEGQWQDKSGAVVREESFVLELIHPADVRSDSAVREVIAEYKRRFGQEAVFRVQDRVQVSF